MACDGRFGRDVQKSQPGNLQRQEGGDVPRPQADGELAGESRHDAAAGHRYNRVPLFGGVRDGRREGKGAGHRRLSAERTAAGRHPPADG